MLEALAIMAFTTSVSAILSGRSGIAWFVIGGLLPVIGLVILNLLPPVVSPVSRDRDEIVIRITLK